MTETKLIRIVPKHIPALVRLAVVLCNSIHVWAVPPVVNRHSNNIPVSLNAESMGSFGDEIPYGRSEEVGDHRVAPAGDALGVAHFTILVEAVTQPE